VKGIDMPLPTYSLDNRVKIGSEDAAALAKVPAVSESEEHRSRARVVDN
jgi:hypothetical protein